MFQGVLKNFATAVLCVGLCDCVGEYPGMRMTLTKDIILVGMDRSIHLDERFSRPRSSAWMGSSIQRA